MSEAFEITKHQAMVPTGRSTDKVPWSLEMDRDGVQLRLASALFDAFLGLSDLALRVPYVGRTFDYTAGPRALQCELTRLANVTVHVSFSDLMDKVRGSLDGHGFIRQVHGGRDRVVLSGAIDETPFTIAVRVEPASHPGAVRLRFVDAHCWDWTPTNWEVLPARIGATIPASLRLASGPDWVELSVLRPVLTRLTTGLGYKAPLLDGTTLIDWHCEQDRLKLFFAPGPQPPIPAISDVSLQSQPAEAVARSVLDDLAGGNRDPSQLERFLRAGAAVPRLAPEVLARAWALGDDRPEAVLPHLIALVVLSRHPNLSPDPDTVRTARRLLAAVEVEDNPLEMFLAAQLIARVSLSMAPRFALEILEDVRAHRVETAAVLEALALALDRLDRRSEARGVRSRALALVPVGQTAATLRQMVNRLESHGLEEVAASWLEQTIEQCDQGAFGSEGGAIRRQAVLLLATRESLDQTRAEHARRRLRDLLAVDPCDREALDLLLALASCGREAAEAIARMKAAAEATHGESRAGFLLDAASATIERLGLRHQAVELLEASLEAAPRNEAATVALDRLYGELGLAPRRLALILRRLEGTHDPVERGVLRFDGAVLAREVGDLPVAATLLGVLLDEEPTHVPGLQLALDVATVLGDSAWVTRLHTVLHDLGHVPHAPSPSQPTVRAVGAPPQPAPLEPAPVDPEPVEGQDASEEMDRFEAESRWLRERMAGGASLLASGDPAGALAAAQDVLEVDPVHLGALRLAVQAATAAGELDRAVDLGRRWVDRIFKPADQVAALLELADVQRLRSLDPAGAVAMLARAASVLPDHPEALSAALALARSLPEAVASILVPVAGAAASGALDADAATRDRCADHLYELAGAAWDDLGANDVALAILEIVIGLAPDHGAARSDLVVLYQASGRVEAANALLAEG